MYGKRKKTCSRAVIYRSNVKPGIAGGARYTAAAETTLLCVGVFVSRFDAWRRNMFVFSLTRLNRKSMFDLDIYK